MGWALGAVGEPKEGHTIQRNKDRIVVPSNKAQKQPQSTCQAKTVIGSSLTPHAALLVPPNGTMYPVVDHHEFTGSAKSCL